MKSKKQGIKRLISFMCVCLILTGTLVCVKSDNIMAFTEKSGYVLEEVNVRTGAGTSNASLGKLEAGHEVTVIGEATAQNGAMWYHVTFLLNGKETTGYIHSDYVRTILPDVSASEDPDYESYLEKQAFPEHYRVYLRALHKAHPTWTFVAIPTGLEWQDALNAESKLGENLVPISSKTSWKSLEEGAIDWTSGVWKGFDGSSWVAASKQAIAFYLDPRNFLRENYRILQFESLEYIEGEQTKEGIANILSGTFMASEEYYRIFMEAGKEAGVNPYHLAARCRQEVGVNGTNSTKDVKDEEYAIFNGYYNYFNIGASPSAEHNSMYNGLARAKAEGWDTPEKSIKGGAAFLAQRYIGVNQNTLYLQKFDVVDDANGLYSHQYMTNLQAAASESNLMKKAYADLDEAVVTYYIPVYLNMPQEAAKEPTYDGSAYCVLSDLSVEGVAFREPFDSYVTEYDAKTDAESITISAKACAPNAVIEGTGTFALVGGVNTFTIQCTGSDQSVLEYTIKIEKGGSTAPASPALGDVNADGGVNASDALLILQSVTREITLTKQQAALADVTADGVVDVMDVLKVLQYASGEIESFE